MRTRIALLLALIFLQVPAVQAQNMTEHSYDPDLDEVIESDDPSQTAETNGLTYRNGSVLLVIEMRGDDDIPNGYGVRVVQEYTDGKTTFVEAYVPVDRIRGIANHSAVGYVRTPAQPMPQTEPEPDMNSTEGTDRQNTSERPSNDTETSDEDAPGFTAVGAILSIVLVALCARWVDVA